ncbi:MAG: ABC transporter ATP-binding protein, partial [Patescibacteria group bacterium]
MPNIIEVKNLTKKYGDFTAVDTISFTVERGEVFGILGPNGAGKTTTLEMIEGLKTITAGDVLVDGLHVVHHERQVKSIIGVQLQASSFFDGLNLKELIATFASLYSREVDPMVLLRQVQLEDKAKSRVRELSGGQKQRLSIAVGLVNEPKVLFLDEPTTGLDPQARRNMWSLISDIKKRGTTIVITTHYMEEAEVLCDHIAIMDHAKIVKLDTPLNLLRKSGVGSTITFHVDKRCLVEHFQRLPAVHAATAEDHGFRLLTTNPEQTLPALFAHESDCKFQLFDLQVRQATLEDVFLKLT